MEKNNNNKKGWHFFGREVTKKREERARKEGERVSDGYHEKSLSNTLMRVSSLRFGERFLLLFGSLFFPIVCFVSFYPFSPLLGYCVHSTFLFAIMSISSNFFLFMNTT